MRESNQFMVEVKPLKNMFAFLICSLLLLSACHSSNLSFREIENVPQKIEGRIDSDFILQLINNGTKGSYVTFHSNGEIEADYEQQDNIVNIIFNELDTKDKTLKRHVYYLTTDSKYDTINVLVNGEEMPFDNVTGI